MDELDKISLNALKCSENTREVPTSSWISVRKLRSKSLLKNHKINDAIIILREICYILPPFPFISDLTFINEAINDIEQN